MLAIEGLQHDIGGRTVLRVERWQVSASEPALVIGPSGSGKSTLLNIIAGIVKPDVGSVRIGAATGDARPPVSYMFQEDRLLPWRTAVKNVELALEPHGLPRRERRERARAALELVGLAAFEGAYPHQLSGGMRSRVALARSLVVEPALLLMDEPFSKLDAQTRSLMHRQLLDIHAARPLTIVFVTHDVEEAVVLADRVTVLAARPGRVREEVDIGFPRPRDPIASDSTRYIQLLRNLI